MTMKNSNIMNSSKTIAQLLTEGRRLTVVSALMLANTTELRREVSRLRRKGWKIEDVWREDNKGHRFKEYYLVK